MYEGDDENRRILFGKYLESLRARSARNTNDIAEAEMGVSKRTFQRILRGHRISLDTQENLPALIELFIKHIVDGDPVLDFDTWVDENEHEIIHAHKIDEGEGGGDIIARDQASPISIKRSNRIGAIAGIIVGAMAILVVAVFYWMWFGEQPKKENEFTTDNAITDNVQISPSVPRPTSEQQTTDRDEIDILRITKSGERRRSEHHPPRAVFTVWNGKLFLKDLVLPNYNPISKIEYSRFSNAWTSFEPSDDLLDRSLAPDGEFLVRATYLVGGKESEKEYDLTTQRDYHLKTVVEGFDITSRVEYISRHISCVDDLCAVQRSHNNNLLCFGPVTRGRLISGFDIYEIDRGICAENAPLPLCLSEKDLGFKLGRAARVVFEVDLIDGTSKRFDVSPRTEGVLRPNGDFVALDALGGTLTHKCD